MAGRRGVRQARRRSHRRLRQDHRPWTYPRSPSTPSLHKAPCGGEGTGPNPTDRAKIGWKWSIATDLFGIPIGWVIDGANRNDSILLEPTLQAVADRGLLADVQTLHLDKGYDSLLTTQRCHGLGLTDVVCAKKTPKGAPKGTTSRKGAPKTQKPPTAKTKKTHSLGLRWPVERTNSWFSDFGQLRRNTDRFSRQRLGQVALAVTLILTVKLVKWAKRWTCLLYTSPSPRDRQKSRMPSS